MSVRVEGNAIHLLAQQAQGIHKVLDPVAMEIARIFGVDVPWGYGSDHDLVVAMPRAAPDLVATLEKTGCV